MAQPVTIHPQPSDQTRSVYFAYIWHGFFLALTMSMLDLNTVFPALIAELSQSRLLFGALYAIMLGAPLLFNLIFSHYLRSKTRKKGFLLFGIYLRSAAFLGMAVSTRLFGVQNPALAAATFFLWVFLFSISAGFAGIAYADLLGKTMSGPLRTRLYAVKQFFASLAAFAGGLVVTGLFQPGRFGFPDQYVISLLVGFAGLLIASAGFYLIREPEGLPPAADRQSLMMYIRQVPDVLRRDRQLRRFILIENMASFSVMILPFYMIYAREIFQLDNIWIGRYLLIQVSGTVLSNLVWGFIANKTSSQSIVRLCVMLGGLIPIIALMLVHTTPGLYGIVFFLLGFIISGRKIGFEPYLLDIAPEAQRTEYLGIRGTLNVFIVVLPIIGGLLINLTGYTLTFILVSLVMLAASLLNRRNAYRAAGDPPLTAD